MSATDATVLGGVGTPLAGPTNDRHTQWGIHPKFKIETSLGPGSLDLRALAHPPSRLANGCGTSSVDKKKKKNVLWENGWMGLS